MARYKRYFYQLEVRMPDGEIIRHRYSTDTFCEVIKKIGVEKIRHLDLMCGGAPLLFPEDLIFQYPHRLHSVGGYRLGMPGPADKKAEVLNKIAKGLGKNLTARVIRDERHSY